MIHLSFVYKQEMLFLSMESLRILQLVEDSFDIFGSFVRKISKHTAYSTLATEHVKVRKEYIIITE
ncbi:hypothetical protein PHOSAC3_120081 [Mesotoga infera]|nr:hypothetical protein PHOSAC3_120081 [Mesotoga infera]